MIRLLLLFVCSLVACSFFLLGIVPLGWIGYLPGDVVFGWANYMVFLPFSSAAVITLFFSVIVFVFSWR